MDFSGTSDRNFNYLPYQGDNEWFDQNNLNDQGAFQIPTYYSADHTQESSTLTYFPLPENFFSPSSRPVPLSQHQFTALPSTSYSTNFNQSQVKNSYPYSFSSYTTAKVDHVYPASLPQFSPQHLPTSRSESLSTRAIEVINVEDDHVDNQIRPGSIISDPALSVATPLSSTFLNPAQQEQLVNLISSQESPPTSDQRPTKRRRIDNRTSSPSDPLTPQSTSSSPTIARSSPTPQFKIKQSRYMSLQKDNFIKHTIEKIFACCANIEQKKLETALQLEIQKDLDKELKGVNFFELLSELHFKHRFFQNFFPPRSKLTIASDGTIQGALTVKIYVGAYLLHKFFAQHRNKYSGVYQFFENPEVPKWILKQLFAFWFEHAEQFECETSILQWLFYQKHQGNSMTVQATMDTLFPSLAEMLEQGWSQNDYIAVVKFIEKSIAVINSPAQPSILISSDEQLFLQYSFHAFNQPFTRSEVSFRHELKELKVICQNWLHASYASPYLLIKQAPVQPMDQHIPLLVPFSLSQKELSHFIKGVDLSHHPLIQMIQARYFLFSNDLFYILRQNLNDFSEEKVACLTRLYIAALICDERSLCQAYRYPCTPERLWMRLNNQRDYFQCHAINNQFNYFMHALTSQLPDQENA